MEEQGYIKTQISMLIFGPEINDIVPYCKFCGLVIVSWRQRDSMNDIPGVQPHIKLDSY